MTGAGWGSQLIFFLPNDSRQSRASPLSLILLSPLSHYTERGETTTSLSSQSPGQCETQPAPGANYFYDKIMGLQSCLVAVAPRERESDGESKREGIRSESEP